MNLYRTEDTIDFLKSAVRSYNNETILQVKLMEKVNNRTLTFSDGPTNSPLKKGKTF
ncbi:hypothetical protein GCM10008932_17330 [Alkalibacterium iburiense]|uniref:Uncharacterized protein n=1 Tax=Alkalibacterium iburiense TaxID=290589 RepID=A0ABP3HBN4_9LACT